LAFKFDPSNQELKKELDMVKQKCKSKCVKDQVGQIEIGINFSIVSAHPAEIKSFDSSNLCSL